MVFYDKQNGLKYREIHNSYGRNVPAKAKQRP